MRSGASISLRRFYGKDLRWDFVAADRHVHEYTDFLSEITVVVPLYAGLVEPVLRDVV